MISPQFESDSKSGARTRPGIVILGVRVDAIRLPTLLSRVAHTIDKRSRLTVMYVNVHAMNVAARDERYRRILDDASIVYCDGTGVRLGAALIGLRVPERMTGADWIHDLCRLAESRGYSILLMGSGEGVAQRAAARLIEAYPRLKIAGAIGGYGPAEHAIAEINAAKPDILLVGMGTPRQEKWIEMHRDRLQTPVVWAVGALFEFVSGDIRRGPRWMTEHGLEWLCRLAVEPRKLWRRYLVGNPWFLWRVLRARLREPGAR